MHSIQKTLIWAKQTLKESNIPSYTLDANLLLSHSLRITREEIISQPHNKLTDKQYTDYNNLIQRRKNNEPISHITGTKAFWDLEFQVTPETLAPRPDSETIIEAALELFPNTNQPLKILDLGTGTGCLALTLLNLYPNSTATATDINPKTLKIAKANSLKLDLAKRCSFVVSNWGEEMENASYNLVVSNPPYIKSSEVNSLQPEIVGFEPKIALDGGKDGLKCYRDLAPYASSLISKGGYVILELGIDQDKPVKDILEETKMEFVAFRKDLAGINRCIIMK